MTTFSTHNDHSYIQKSAAGTHLQGWLDIPYKDLVAKLGEPHFGDGEKVQVEWTIEFDDGTIATIYDWKDPRSVQKIEHWHVGGFDYRAVEYVQDLFESSVAEICPF